jgi:hypothetical protein
MRPRNLKSRHIENNEARLANGTERPFNHWFFNINGECRIRRNGVPASSRQQANCSQRSLRQCIHGERNIDVESTVRQSAENHSTICQEISYNIPQDVKFCGRCPAATPYLKFPECFAETLYEVLIRTCDKLVSRLWHQAKVRAETIQVPN